MPERPGAVGAAAGPTGAGGDARRADLDALRGFAMLVGVVLHATLSFTSLLGRPADVMVSDPAPFDLIYFAIHGFRMPLFFLLSGYFTALVWRRRGLVALLRQRTRRIAVPLAVGVVTIVPVMDAVVARVWGAAPDQPFSFHHLWFLWYLLLFVVGFLAIAPLTRAVGVPARLRTLVSRSLVPLTLVPQLAMGGGGAARTFGPDASPFLVPQAHHLGYFALFFAFGVLAHRRRTTDGRLVMDAIGTRTSMLAALSVAMFVVGMALTFGGGDWLIASTVQVAYAWVTTFMLIGLFRRSLRVERRELRYLADASYWIYLVHLPLVLWLQAGVADVPIPAAVKFVGIIAVTTVVCLASYQLLVRHTPVGAVLNGPRPRGAVVGAA